LALLTGRLAAEGINSDQPGQYQRAIDGLPFTGSTLLRAQEIFYGFDDETLNQLGEVLHGKRTALVATDDGRKALMERPKLREHQAEIAEFAAIWQSAREYLW